MKKGIIKGEIPMEHFVLLAKMMLDKTPMISFYSALHQKSNFIVIVDKGFGSWQNKFIIFKYELN